MRWRRSGEESKGEADRGIHTATERRGQREGDKQRGRQEKKY